MNYTIRRGDTLWALARKHGTTINALMKANPQIKNRDLIFAGARMSLPGSSDGFDRPSTRPSTRPSSGRPAPKPNRPNRPAAPPRPAPTPGAGGGGGSRKAYDLARSVLGRNAGELKLSSGPIGKAMHDWVPNNVNCANFVSGVLRVAGQINSSQHHNAVVGLMGNLDRDSSWRRVSLKDARPGDVVSMKTPGGQHVVLFAGWKNGKPLYIGSNNVNPDGSQKITYSHFNYPIMAVHQYKG